MKAHRNNRMLPRRILAVALAAVMVLTLFPILSPREAVFADGASEPSILRQPADATYAEGATARFYVSASSPEGGYLTYKWYVYGPDDGKAPDPNGADYDDIIASSTTPIADSESIGNSATSAVLTIETPTPADTGTHWYYYWAEITNHFINEDNIETTEYITTRIAEAKIVDRTLFPAVQNGDFQAYSNNSYNPLRSFPPSSGYWNTTHEGTPDGRDSSTGKQLETGSGYLAANTTLAAELSAFRSSTIYQEIATVPGKIYEWKLDHGARTRQVSNSNPDVMAVVIGPAINEESDYTAMGVPNYWNNVGSEFNNAIITTRKSNLFATPFTYEYGPNPTKVAPTCALPENGGAYNYGVNMNTHFNAIVNQVLAESGVTAANYNANNGSTFNDVDRSYSTTYGGKPYYVFISAARRNGSWFTRAGSYTVPAGQGTTVFGFVSVSSPSGAASGNILDNITFASGATLETHVDISYTGDTELSVDTRSGYAYGLTELRGSSAITLYDKKASYDPDGAGTTDPTDNYPTTPGVGDGNQWYAGLGAGGVLTFTGLTPGKTYRVVGVPAQAINEGLGTNIYPADVLDDGYYADVKIQPAKSSDDQYVAAVTAGIDENNDAFITVENSRNDVEYALRKAVVDGNTITPNISPDDDESDPAEWTPGGGDLRFEGLKQGVTYYLVARPYGYSEIKYADAAYGPDGKTIAAIAVTTPKSGGDEITGVDILAEQIERTNEPAGDSAIDTIKINNTKAGYTYALVNPASGEILETVPVVTAGTDVTFNGQDDEGLNPGTIYQVVTRLTNGGAYMKGVRVYPPPPALSVDYVNERIYLAAADKTPTFVPNTVRYSFEQDPDPNDGDWTRATGAGYIDLTNELELLSGEATGTLTYSVYVAQEDYTGAKVQPELTLDFDARPPTPVVGVDYTNEKIVITNIDELSALEYRAGASGLWISVDKNTGIKFEDLGWTGRQSITAYFRVPATESTFTSVTESVTIPARTAAPSGLSARLTNGGDTIEILGLGSGDYQYRIVGESEYTPKNIPADGSTLSDLPFEGGQSYEVRYAATESAPASRSATVKPEPINMAAVDFGEKIYGTAITPQDVKIINTSGSSISGVTFSLSGDDSGIFELIIPNTDTVVEPGAPVTVEENTTTPVAIRLTSSGDLPAKEYKTTIMTSYGNGGSTTADVTLTVIKAPWDMVSIAGVVPEDEVTDTSFTISVTGAPEGAELEWRLGSVRTDPTEKPNSNINGTYTFSNLRPQTTYPISVTALGDDNHNASDEVQIATAHTAMAKPTASEVVRIDYINETLLFNTGFNPTNYTINIIYGSNISEQIGHMDSVSEFADTGNFTVSVARNETSAADGGKYPISEASTFVVDGRLPAPEVTVHYAATDISNDGSIEKVGGGAFQYRLAGSGAGGWQNVNNQVTALRPDRYDVRLAPTASVFASHIGANKEVHWNGLAVSLQGLTTDGRSGKTATSGIVITFNRDVAGLPASAVTVTSASQGAVTAGTVTDNGDNDAKTWRVNVAVNANNAIATVTIANWEYNGQNYTVASPASDTVTVYAPVQADMKKVEIDYEHEILTELDPGLYKLNVSGVGSGTFRLEAGQNFPIKETWMTGTENGLSLRLDGGDDNTDSATQTVTIPARRAAPTGIGVTQTVSDDTASITGVDETMEYSTGDGAWSPVTNGQTQIDIKSPGAYYLRYKAIEASGEPPTGKFSSKAAQVYIHAYGAVSFGEALEGYTAGTGGEVKPEPVTIDTGTITNVTWVNESDKDKFTLEGGGAAWTIVPKPELTRGTYNAKINISYTLGSPFDQDVSFTVHPKAEIKKVTQIITKGDGGLTDRLQIKFVYPVELDYDAVYIDGAAVKPSEYDAGFTCTDDKKTYTLAVEPPVSAKTGDEITVSVDLGDLGADYAYQLAHNKSEWTKKSTNATIPRSIVSANVGAAPAGYATAYIQFTLDHDQYAVDADDPGMLKPEDVVITYTDTEGLTQRINVSQVVRIDADMGYTFRALINPTESAGNLTIYIGGITDADMPFSFEGNVIAAGAVAGPGYYLDENGRNYLMTMADEFQGLPGLALGTGGQEYAAHDYTLRTNAEYDAWTVSAVYVDGNKLETDCYAISAEANQLYIFDKEAPITITNQLRITLKQITPYTSWAETNGEHKIVTVLTGKTESNKGDSLILSGRIVISGLTPTYTLTVLPAGGSGSGKYPANRSVYITANEAPEGKAFYMWVIAEGSGGILSNAYAPSTTFVMPAGAATVTATYMDRQDTPTAAIDYENERFTKLEPGASYTWTLGAATGTFTAQADTNDASNGGVYAIPETWMTATGASSDPNFSLVRNAGGDKAASLPQIMSIPARGAIPDVETVAETFIGFKDGKLIYVDDSMQYKLAVDTKWKNLTSAEIAKGEVESLAPDRYNVRYKGSTATKRFASESALITIMESTVAPTWGVSLSAASVSFPSVAFGYAPVSPVTVTITNTGNQPTGNLTVTLGGTNLGDFILSSANIDGKDIPRYGTAAFTVTPRTGLDAGSYSATVTVEGSNTLPSQYGKTSVNFTVSAATISGFDSLDLVNAGTIDQISTEPDYAGYKESNILQTLKIERPKITAHYAGSTDGAEINVDSWTVRAGKDYSDSVAGEYVFEATPDTTSIPAHLLMPTSSTPKAIVTVKVQEIEHGVSLKTSGYAFPETQFGYTPIEKSVAVTNIGTQATGALSVELSGTDADKFTLTSGNRVASIAKDDTGYFTVKPIAGLTPDMDGTPKTYIAMVKVEGSSEADNDDLVHKTYALSFTVKAAEITAPTVLSPPVDGGVAGFGPTPFDDADAVIAYLEEAYPKVTMPATNGQLAEVTVSAWNDTDDFNPAVVGSYTFTATINDTDIPANYTNHHSYTATTEVTVDAPNHAKTPNITVNPSSVYDGFVGETYTLKTEAISREDEGVGGLSYQWYTGSQADYNNDTGTIIGINSMSYTVPNTAATSYYWCVVTNTNNDATGRKTATAKSALAVVNLRYAGLDIEGGAIVGSDYENGDFDGEAYGYFAAGETVRIKADEPQTDYVFQSWTRNGTWPDVELPKIAEGTFKMPAGDLSIKAAYAEIYRAPTYLLTVVNGAGSGDYTEGTSVTITANAPPAGQVFDKWTQSAGSTISLPTGSTGTITMPASAVTITATYGSQQSSSSGSGGSSGAPSAAPAIVADDGRVSLDYTISGDTVNISLPNNKITEIIENASAGTASVDVSGVSDVNAVTFLPKTGLSDIADAELGIKVIFPHGTVELDSDAVHSLVAMARGDEITVAVVEERAPDLNPVQAAALPEASEVFDISVYSGGVLIHEYSGVITVTVPYTGRTPVSAWYLAGDGALEKLPSTYSAEDETVSFIPPHLSLYVVGYDGWPFTDVTEGIDWFYEDVAYVYGEGLMLGTSETLFSPNAQITRGMLVTILGRRYGVNADEYKGASFTDVNTSEYYAPYIKWAAENGIVLGVGEDKFAPDARISRQDFAVILYRYTDFAGGGPLGIWATNVTFDNFSDITDISDYAVNAIRWATGMRVMNGKPNNIFDPTGGATRAEAAAMLHRLFTQGRV